MGQIFKIFIFFGQSYILKKQKNNPTKFCLGVSLNQYSRTLCLCDKCNKCVDVFKVLFFEKE